MKMIYYKLVKIFFNAPRLAKVIIDVVLYYHYLLDLIVIDKESFFTSKFWSLFCYFFDIKRRLSIIFHLQTDIWTKQQNSLIEAYLQFFDNFE